MPRRKLNKLRKQAKQRIRPDRGELEGRSFSERQPREKESGAFWKATSSLSQNQCLGIVLANSRGHLSKRSLHWEVPFKATRQCRFWSWRVSLSVSLCNKLGKHLNSVRNEPYRTAFSIHTARRTVSPIAPKRKRLGQLKTHLRTKCKLNVRQANG